MRRVLLLTWLALHAVCTTAFCAAAPSATQIDTEARRLMARESVKGLALAVVEDGQIRHVQAFGERKPGEPLQTDTVMYGASLTKAVFAYTVLQLAEEGRIDLDAPLSRYLLDPWAATARGTDFAPWRAPAGDERWRKLTARILLSHRGGFANFAFLEPDGKLRFHFEPGQRYAYSGEGLLMLQHVLERGLGLDVGAEMRRRVFERFGMRRTSMSWQSAFADNTADGYEQGGKQVPHVRRQRVRAAGSMDTSIEDFARFAAGFMRGEGLSAASRAEMTRSQGAITTAQQFPTLAPELPPQDRRRDLAAGLGVVLFDGPQGPGFFKGGHDDNTGNSWVCVDTGRRCVVLLGNDVRAERIYPALVRFILGETGVPWVWEYGPDAASR